MSITSDIRAYADTAVNQGKQVLDQTVATAQAQLNDVSGSVTASAGEFVDKARGNVSDIAGKASEAVTDLRASAEKAINLDALKSAIEPYLAQVKDYSATVTDRAEALLSGIRSDKRVAKLVDTAGSVSGAVVETVQERVVKPVQSLTGMGAKPRAKRASSPAKKAPSPESVSKPAATKPATKPAATKPATKAASKPARKPAARKAPAKRVTKA